MIKEFKEFIMRGNVIDLAVAVIIGAAFTAIVNSLVADIIMPIIGAILGGINFSGLAVTVGEAIITYGNFIQAIINFLLIALVLFLMIRAINAVNRRKVEAPTPPAPTAEEKLLTEIRDLLRERR